MSGPSRLVVITGGPGAGKTALLELARRRYGDQVVILPEAASILFAGGFPRRTELVWQRASQRAIYHVQRQLERATLESNGGRLVLCDRGTLDGLAYWPERDEGLVVDVGTTRELELLRYAAVIHLRTPPSGAFNHQNPMRIETAAQAHVIDDLIVKAWAGHSRRHLVPSSPDFLAKVEEALRILDGIVHV